MAEAWAEWGWLAYAAAFAWAFCEGETFVLVAAAAGNATGLIDPWALMLSVWGGSFAGDQLWFALGRRYGPRALRRAPAAERGLAAASALLDRYGALFVLSFRFVYGVRNVAAAACGAAGMGRARFALLNLAAAGLWAASFVAIGWCAAAWLGAERLAQVVGALGLAGVAVVGARLWTRRRGRSPPPGAERRGATRGARTVRPEVSRPGLAGGGPPRAGSRSGGACRRLGTTRPRAGPRRRPAAAPSPPSSARCGR